MPLIVPQRRARCRARSLGVTCFRPGVPERSGSVGRSVNPEVDVVVMGAVGHGAVDQLDRVPA